MAIDIETPVEIHIDGAPIPITLVRRGQTVRFVNEIGAPLILYFVDEANTSQGRRYIPFDTYRIDIPTGQAIDVLARVDGVAPDIYICRYVVNVDGQTRTIEGEGSPPKIIWIA